MDGAYTLESLRFSKKLSLNYRERLTQNTLSGFVLSTNGNSVKNALVTLKKGTATLKKCYTDENGHYQLKNASKANRLIVEKTGFQKIYSKIQRFLQKELPVKILFYAPATKQKLQ